MALILLVFLGIALFLFPSLRCMVFHPITTVRNSVRDLSLYVLRKKHNVCKTGELIAYVGLFGKGKTLSVVHRVVIDYKRYHNKPVYFTRRGKMVTQRIKVLSNVTLSIPYENLVSLEQIILCAENNRSEDDVSDTLTITLVLGDEFSVQMNSRNFKNNIDPLFLNTLLTCRHYHISLFYTAQRFGHVEIGRAHV